MVLVDLTGEDQAQDRRVSQRCRIFERAVHRLEATSQVEGNGEWTGGAQTENELPHPQLPVVLGLPNLNPAPCSPST